MMSVSTAYVRVQQMGSKKVNKAMLTTISLPIHAEAISLGPKLNQEQQNNIDARGVESKWFYFSSSKKRYVTFVFPKKRKWSRFDFLALQFWRQHFSQSESLLSVDLSLSSVSAPLSGASLGFVLRINTGNQSIVDVGTRGLIEVYVTNSFGKTTSAFLLFSPHLCSNRAHVRFSPLLASRCMTSYS